MSENVNNTYGLCQGCWNEIVEEDYVIIDGKHYHNDSECIPAVAVVAADSSLEFDEVGEIEPDDSEESDSGPDEK